MGIKPCVTANVIAVVANRSLTIMARSDSPLYLFYPSFHYVVGLRVLLDPPTSLTSSGLAVDRGAVLTEDIATMGVKSHDRFTILDDYKFRDIFSSGV